MCTMSQPFAPARRSEEAFENDLFITTHRDGCDTQIRTYHRHQEFIDQTKTKISSEMSPSNSLMFNMILSNSFVIVDVTKMYE